jgi:hypothetical protein
VNARQRRREKERERRRQALAGAKRVVNIDERPDVAEVTHSCAKQNDSFKGRDPTKGREACDRCRSPDLRRTASDGSPLKTGYPMRISPLLGRRSNGQRTRDLPAEEWHGGTNCYIRGGEAKAGLACPDRKSGKRDC